MDGTIAAKPNAAISTETIMWFSHRTRAEFSARTTFFDVLLIIYPTFPPRYIASFFFLSFSYLLHALLPTRLYLQVSHYISSILDHDINVLRVPSSDSRHPPSSAYPGLSFAVQSHFGLQLQLPGSSWYCYNFYMWHKFFA